MPKKRFALFSCVLSFLSLSCGNGIQFGNAGGGGSGTFFEEFNQNGSWTVPSGVHTVIIEAVGAGGGGGGSINQGTSPTNDAQGGGPGGYVKAIIPANTGDVISFTIGTGGLGGNSGSAVSCSNTAAPLPTAGSSGSPTEVFQNGNFLVTAGGGQGGGAELSNLPGCATFSMPAAAGGGSGGMLTLPTMMQPGSGFGAGGKGGQGGNSAPGQQGFRGYVLITAY